MFLSYDTCRCLGVGCKEYADCERWLHKDDNDDKTAYMTFSDTLNPTSLKKCEYKITNA